ncbi:MAG: hypothetical protein KC900_04500 [Candidatus Omnitrophica bacterium]|nr:hypothetical protein [Candidatus Omnitrophota bacterium]
MTYYYFGASLPVLTFSGKLPFTVAEFLDDARRQMTRGDARLLVALLGAEHIATASPVLKQVFEFEQSLNNHVAVYRALKLNRDPQTVTRGAYGANPELQQLVKDAANAADPLEGDKVLSRARWNFYENLMVGEFYTPAFIMLYGLKLKIVERYHNIASPQGREKYEELKKVDFPEGMFANL